MIENHKFLDAYFTDNDRRVIESLWIEDETRTIRPYHITATDDNPNYKELLLKYIDLDELHERTFKNIRAKKEALDAHAMNMAKEQGLLNVDGIGELFWKQTAESLFKEEFDEKKDKEELFIYKLQLFEQEKIKGSKNREAKAKLRKSKNFLEATHAAISIVLEE